MSIEVVPEVDVSALALEATLTAIKGAGWTTETLVAIMAAIVALPPGATAAQIWAYATRNLTNPGVASNLGNMQVDGLTQAPAGQKTWPLAVDYTAARAANLDAAISSRSTLTQAQMLSDATPFPGARIDATISSRLAAASYTAERGTDNAMLAADGALEASALARYNIIKTTEVEISQAPATENAAVTIAVITADQSLGAKNITANVPTGATITKVIALARISIMNNSATAQKIDLKFEVEGIVLFNQTDVIGFGAVDGTSGCYIIAEDATDEVTADSQVVTLEAKVTLSSANAVRFQAQYYLFITYKMG